ncbi:MAG: hypothetical protein KF780_10055 [Sphingomonas sp.]|nr:hypothetical protein [Sphingomonas sp.]
MPGYNERLFGGGVRKRLHEARFHWLEKASRSLDCSTVFELGCFDGKAINYLPRKPERYVGADANWEGGLDDARKLWPQFEFHNCRHPDDILDKVSGPFSLSIAMETFEHIPPAIVPDYIDFLADITRGHVLITVPVEFGPVFLGKYLAKQLVGSFSEKDGEVRSYTLGEVMNATIGRTSRVRRGEHKGFDYRWLRALLGQRFDIIASEGHPFRLGPPWLNFGVGILARSRSI